MFSWWHEAPRLHLQSVLELDRIKPARLQAGLHLGGQLEALAPSPATNNLLPPACRTTFRYLEFTGWVARVLKPHCIVLEKAAYLRQQTLCRAPACGGTPQEAAGVVAVAGPASALGHIWLATCVSAGHRCCRCCPCCAFWSIPSR